MDFIEKIEELAKKALSQKNLVTDEAKTKDAIIRPFIELLEYDLSNPEEVQSEYDANLPKTSKDKKVDYAIFIDESPIDEGSPTIIFECKKLGSNLGPDEWGQLCAYFVNLTPVVRYGVLTNGMMKNPSSISIC